MLRRCAFVLAALFMSGAAGVGLTAPNALASASQIHNAYSAQLSVNAGPNSVRHNYLYLNAV
jgi:hypothetical protein